MTSEADKTCFGNDMYADTVEELMEMLRSRLERAETVLRGVKTETHVPLTFTKE